MKVAEMVGCYYHDHRYYYDSSYYQYDQEDGEDGVVRDQRSQVHTSLLLKWLWDIQCYQEPSLDH